MLQAYESGDPYLGLAKQAGAVPEDATKATHRREREQFKECAIAILYGSGAHKLAKRIAQPEAVARDLLAEHRQRYSVFWNWVEETVDRAFSEGRLQTGLGWTLHVDRSFNALTLRNFPIQATGADMLRVACCLATEWGVRVCATAHDAILIEAPLEKLNEHVEMARSAMAEASKFVLDGFELRTDVKVFPYPERYRDDRGTKTWERIWRIVERLDGGS
jgi:DNA polymerase I-like protein with 3'-5' exonuclease and polymerase domains